MRNEQEFFAAFVERESLPCAATVAPGDSFPYCKSVATVLAKPSLKVLSYKQYPFLRWSEFAAQQTNPRL
jgi:hypothetical protein